MVLRLPAATSGGRFFRGGEEQDLGRSAILSQDTVLFLVEQPIERFAYSSGSDMNRCHNGILFDIHNRYVSANYPVPNEPCRPSPAPPPQPPRPQPNSGDRVLVLFAVDMPLPADDGAEIKSGLPRFKVGSLTNIQLFVSDHVGETPLAEHARSSAVRSSEQWRAEEHAQFAFARPSRPDGKPAIIGDRVDGEAGGAAAGGGGAGGDAAAAVVKATPVARVRLGTPMHVQPGARLGLYLHSHGSASVRFHHGSSARPGGEGLELGLGVRCDSGTPFERVNWSGAKDMFAGTLHYDLAN